MLASLNMWILNLNLVAKTTSYYVRHQMRESFEFVFFFC